MQDPSDLLSAFCYGSSLQSTITAANLLRSQTGLAGLTPFQAQQQHFQLQQLQQLQPQPFQTLQPLQQSLQCQPHHQQQQQQQFIQLNGVKEAGMKPVSRTSGSKKEISPFDPESIVPLPTQLSDFKAKNFGTTIWRRNERERFRVRCVNTAYDDLRNVLPFDEDEKRLSKVETLRLSILYIHHLEKMLTEYNHSNTCDCFEEFQRQLVENETKRIDQRLSGRDSDES